MTLHSLLRALAFISLATVPTQSAAFEMDACTTVTHGPRLSEDILPDGPIAFFLEPGLIGGDLDCYLFHSDDAPWELEVYQPIEGAPDDLWVAYLQDRVVMLFETDPDAPLVAFSQCEPGEEFGAFVACTTALKPGTRWLSYVRRFDETLTPMSDLVQVNIWDVVTTRLTTVVPPFFHTPDEERAAAISANGQGNAWELEPTPNPEVFWVTDPADVAEITDYAQSAAVYRITLSLDWALASESPASSRTTFDADFGELILGYGEGLEKFVLRNLPEPPMAE